MWSVLFQHIKKHSRIYLLDVGGLYLETKKQEIDLNLILAFPIVFILGVIPLVVHFKILPLPEAVKVVWGEKDIDMFSYYKSMMILGSTLMLLIGLIIKTLQDKRIKIPACFYPMFVYLIFVILSAVFSSYGFISMWGVPSRYEGVLVLVSYVVIMVATANIVVEEKQIKLLLGALFISAGLIGIIGVFQYFGLDFFRSEFAKCVILPSNLRNMNIQFNFGKNIIYSTLFNPNNVGSYAAMLFPVSLCFYIFIRQKWPKVLLGVFSCLMFIVWIGCQSLMGNIGGCFALALMVTLWGKKIVSRYRSLLIVIVAYVIIFFIMNFSSSGSLIHNAAKIKGLGSNDFVIDVKQEKISDLTIVTQKSGLKISYDKGKLEFFDIDGKYLSYSSKVANGKQDEEKLVIDDKAYYSYDIKMQNINNDNLRLCIDKSGVNFDLILTKMGIGFVDSRGYGNPQSKVEMIDIKGKEAYGSGRFYIWSRSIPLIKKTLLIGNGPDT
ncbi:MAG TPA: hypothetical protein VF941_01205, partial [Clostridia bacterium]